MPLTKVVFYRDEGIAPAYDKLQELLAAAHRKPFAKCYNRIDRLAEKGHELHRPEADYLRDGVYELRATHQSVNYRILYFFSGQQVAVLSHLIRKDGKVPEAEIDRAVRHKAKFEADPEKHTLRL